VFFFFFKGNWGKEGDPEQEFVNQEGEEIKEVKEEEVVEEVPKEETEEEKSYREEQEKEAKMMTLEDYIKSKKTTAFALPEVRKVNEGVDPKEEKKWAQYQVVKKKDDDEDEEEKAKEDKKKNKEKSTVRVDEIFNIKPNARPRDDNDRPRGGRGGSRGGRGGSRGGRGDSKGSRGSSRGGRGGQGGEPVNFNDPNSFPTLASKA